MRKFAARICLRIWLAFTGLKFYKKELVPSDPPIRIIKAPLVGVGSLQFLVYRKRYENVIFGLFSIKHRNYRAYVIRCDFSALGHHNLQQFNDLSFVLLARHARMFEEDMIVELLMNKYLLYIEYMLKQEP